MRPVSGFKVGDRVGERGAYRDLHDLDRFRYGTVFSVTFSPKRNEHLLMIRWDGDQRVTRHQSLESLRPEAEARVLEARVRLGDSDA